MKTILGLGNPGHSFHETRHNLGFRVIQRLVERRHVAMDQRVVSSIDQRPAAVYGDYQDGAETVRLVMPLTMMNESGEALRAVEIRSEALLIVCDDVNLPLGALRLRPEGSAGGHHGLESCVSVLGTERVPRLRIGVGASEMPRDLQNFVLSRFRSTERPLAARMIEQAADACESWVKEGIEAAMNRYNKTQDTSP